MTDKKIIVDESADAAAALEKLRQIYRNAHGGGMEVFQATNSRVLTWACEELEELEAVEQRRAMYSRAIEELTVLYRRAHKDLPENMLPDTGKVTTWAAGVMQRMDSEVNGVIAFLKTTDWETIDWKYVWQRLEMALQGTARMPMVTGPQDIRHAAATALGFGSAGYTLVSALAGAQDVERRMREFVSNRIPQFFDASEKGKRDSIVDEFNEQFPEGKK